MLKRTASHLSCVLSTRIATRHTKHLRDGQLQVTSSPFSHQFGNKSCRSSSTSSDASHYLLLGGMSFQWTEQHVIDFLKDVQVVNGSEGITFILSQSALRNGTAFIQVATADDAEAANMCKGESNDEKYIKVYPTSKGKLGRLISQNKMTPFRSTTGHTVETVGIVDTALKESILNFFSPLKPASVEFRVGFGQIKSHSWRTLRAYVDFASHEEAVEAMERHKEMMEDKKASLRLLSYPGKCTCYPKPKEETANQT